MKLILAAARYQFLGFFKNARVVLTFLPGIVICFLLSGRVMEIKGERNAESAKNSLVKAGFIVE